MTDLLLTSIRDAILPEIQQLIESAFKKQSAETLAEKFLSVDAAQKMFEPKVSRGTIYNWVEAGYLTSYVIGGRRVFKYSEVLEAVQKIKKYSRKSEAA